MMDGSATKTKEKVYITHNHMNKPIRMMGLSSLQLFGVIGVLGLTLVILTAMVKASMMVTLIVFSMMVIPLIMLIAKLTKEHKKGCPDFIKSYFTFGSTPRKIIDSKSVLSMIYQSKSD